LGRNVVQNEHFDENLRDLHNFEHYLVGMIGNVVGQKRGHVESRVADDIAEKWHRRLDLTRLGLDG